jgi:hypothetical protein
MFHNLACTFAAVCAFTTQAGARDGPAISGKNSAPETAEDRLYVRNLDAHRHFFAVDARDDTRRSGYLSPRGTLCTKTWPGLIGMVSVFETANAI